MGRDETAEHVGSSITFLKKQFQKFGGSTWPSRPLVPTTYQLWQKKGELLSATTAACYVLAGTAAFTESQNTIEQLRQNILDLREKRKTIIEKSLSPEFYKDFVQNTPEDMLDPNWEVLPPLSPPQPVSTRVTRKSSFPLPRQ